MARPKRQGAERRDARFPSPRVTEFELSRLYELAGAAGYDPADFLRELVKVAQVTRGGISAEFEAKAKPPADDALLAELNRIGVNLNQITQRLHQTGRVPVTLPELIEEIRRLIDRLPG